MSVQNKPQVGDRVVYQSNCRDAAPLKDGFCSVPAKVIPNSGKCTEQESAVRSYDGSNFCVPNQDLTLILKGAKVSDK